MKDKILARLRALEKERDIKILYACESGSRAWGFASPNSDWDVRFIYVHPRDWYLSIQEKKDMIDLGVDAEELDFTGWELRKFLRLMAGSNASPYEWLQSPMIYQEVGNFRNELQALFPSYFKARSTAFHYLGLAKSSLKKGLVGAEMDIKKYFYILRPLLAARWILTYKTAPPMEFAPLLAELQEETDLYQSIMELTAAKMKANEGDKITPIPLIQDFVHQELEDCSKRATLLPGSPGDYQFLNDFFRTTINTL
ncbi:MAG: nucleotidyltransferase domain-containing protein [Aureispira sp.]